MVSKVGFKKFVSILVTEHGKTERADGVASQSK
jgi:hypothetical protein